MLFYMNKEEDMVNIPSSFITISISNIIKNHPNIENGNLLLPQRIMINDKDSYKKSLKLKLVQIIPIVQLLRLDSANSVVLVSDKKDIHHYGFNYVKQICKFIKKRYGIQYFKFTNCITRDMRTKSKFSEDGLDQLLIDLKMFEKELRKNESI